MGTRFLNFPQLQAIAVSGTATVHSVPTNLNQLHNVGLQIKFLGTMAGTLSVECSNDGVEYDALVFTPAISQPAGSNLSFLINLNQVPYNFVRVSYTNASGSGTLTSILTAKDLA